MKKLLPILLLMTLPVVFAGCSKEPVYVEEGDIAIREVTYAINGEKQQTTLRGDDEWDVFVNMLFDKIDEGYLVTFQCTNTTYTDMAKANKPRSLKTANREEALSWASKMGKEGYVVIVSYDKKKKIYKCQALK